MAQWWPLATQNDEDSRALVRSFLDAFPFATLWSTELHEMLLVGSTSPIRLDAAQIVTRYSRSETAAALRTVGVKSAAALLGTWITNRSGLERYTGDTPAVTDDGPRIEHAAWVRRGEFQRVLPRVWRWRRTCPSTETSVSHRPLMQSVVHSWRSIGPRCRYTTAIGRRRQRRLGRCVETRSGESVPIGGCCSLAVRDAQRRVLNCMAGSVGNTGVTNACHYFFDGGVRCSTTSRCCMPAPMSVVSVCVM